MTLSVQQLYSPHAKFFNSKYEDLTDVQFPHTWEWEPKFNCYQPGGNICHNSSCPRHGKEIRIHKAHALKPFACDSKFMLFFSGRINAYVEPWRLKLLIKNFTASFREAVPHKGYVWTVEWEEFVPHFHMLSKQDDIISNRRICSWWVEALDFVGKSNPSRCRTKIEYVPLLERFKMVDYIYKTDLTWWRENAPPKLKGLQLSYVHPKWGRVK